MNQDINALDISRFSFKLFYNRSHFNNLRVLISNYDIVHVHIYYGQITNSLLFILASFKGRVVFTLHEYKLVCPIGTTLNKGSLCTNCNVERQWPVLFSSCDAGSFFRRFGLFIDNLISHYAMKQIKNRHFLFVSNFQRQSYGFRGRSIITSSEVLPLFTMFDKASKVKKLSKEKRILYAGRIEEGKGVFMLLNAFLEMDSEYILEYAGDGPDFHKLKERIQKLQIGDRVIMHGLLGKKELKSVMLRASHFVNPSRYLETFGLVNLEAMSLGCIVISSSSGALGEVLKDGFNGFIVKSLDEGGIKEAFERSQSVAENEIIFNAIKTSKKYNIDNHIDELIRIYKNAGTNR